MLLREFSPPPVIADIVRQIAFYSDPVPTPGLQRVLPNGEIEIVVNLAEDALRCHRRDTLAPNRRSGAVVAGIHRSYFVIESRQLTKLMALRLQPGAIWRLLGVPADELTDTHLDLSDLLGVKAHEISQRLVTADNPAACVATIAIALGAQRHRTLHPAVVWAAHQISHYPARTRVARLADESGLSMRRFNELFTRQIGINPKAFARIRRFGTTIKQLHHARRHGWGAFAHELGYSDQAHLIRDFREFSGFSPTQFVSSAESIAPESSAPASAQLTAIARS